jgi:hypothetical protein
VFARDGVSEDALAAFGEGRRRVDAG